MDKEKRKALQTAYMDRGVVGGVYYIKCNGNQRIWLRSTTDIIGAQHRVTFSLKMKGAPEPSMQRECNEYGWESFSFVVLEEHKRGSLRTISQRFTKYGKISCNAAS